MIQFAIIIPIYNAANVLERCLSTITEQIYRNFIVYLIDDGSTDDSEQICRAYCRKDKRFKYYFQENSGVSSARNLGLSKLNNVEYVVFIDPDDMIYKDHLLNFYSLINRYNCVDMIVCSFKKFKNNTWIHYFHRDGFVSIEEFLYKCLMDKSVYGYVWNKVFKKSIIDGYHVRFDENIKISEDLLFVFQYARYSEHILMSSKISYSYLIGSTSITGLGLDVSNFQSRITVLDAYEKMLYIINNNNRLTNILRNYLTITSATFYRFSQIKIKNSNESDRLKKIAKHYHSKSELSFLQQLKYICDIYFPWIIDFIKKISIDDK